MTTPLLPTLVVGATTLILSSSIELGYEAKVAAGLLRTGNILVRLFGRAVSKMLGSKSGSKMANDDEWLWMDEYDRDGITM